MANTNLKEFISKTKPQFLKYKKYLIANDWTDDSGDIRIDDSYINDLYSDDTNKVKKAEIKKLLSQQIAAQKGRIQFKSDEFKLQNELVSNMIDRIKYIVKKNEGNHSDKDFRNFIKLSLGIIKIHTSRVDNYVESIDISKIDNQEVRSEEIKLIKDCFSGVSKINDAIDSLNIKEEHTTEFIEFLEGHKATLAMHKDLVRLYPKIKTKLDSMGIDFDSPPPPTLHILNENPPTWVPELNYWEQEKSVLQYYVDEYKKIDYGVTIDGYYFDGWLYFHFNHFITKIPTTVIKGGIEENEDVVKTPELRDNEIHITDYFIKSKREAKMSLIAATRRAAKTTLNGSRISRAQILGRKQILCAGGSAEDLGHISLNVDTSNEYINPAFKLYYLSPTEDGRGKSYGIKSKSNKSKVTSNVYIINLEGGTSRKKKETLAGFTPDEFILDEAMKFPFKHQLEALEPALWGVGVLRCSVIITGTGGDSDLAVDAINMLNNPEGNRICLMDWDQLEKGVDKEDITWQRRPYGLFLPTQMCIKHVKIKTNFSDYLGLDSNYLKNLPIWVTNWKSAKRKEQDERDSKVGDKKAYTRLLAYHPFDPAEIFLSGKENEFPVKEAKAHKEYLLKTGLWDRRRELYRDSEGKIRIEISTRELAPFPFNGSNIDCPFLIFEDPPTEKVRWGTYTAGMDDYKHESAESASLGTFYVWKNESLGDPFSKRIVASLTCRPNRHKEFHEKCLLLMEAYQLEGTVFPENEDLSIKEFLDGKHLTDKYLATSLDFTQNFNLPNSHSRKYGWTPQSSKKTLFNLFVEHMNETYMVEDKDGNIQSLKGVQLVDDIWLLEEMIQYTDNQNVDRIISAMGGYGFVHYLISSYKWKVREMQKEVREGKIKPQTKREKNFYGTGNRPRSFYRSR